MRIRYEQIALPQEFPLVMQKMDIPPLYDMNGYFHYHDCFEIAVITGGSGRYRVEERVYPVSPGDVLVINHIEPHNLTVEETGLQQLLLIFDPRLVWNWDNDHDYKYVQPFLERVVLLANCIPGDSEPAHRIRKTLEEMYREYSDRSEGWPLMVKALLLAVLTRLFRHFRCDEIVPCTRQGLLKLKEAIAYIHAHYAEEITLQKLADMVHLTPGYFCTLFRSVTGVSYSRYLNTVRIRHAEQLLRQSTYTVTRIAGECGYNSMSHFYETFQQITGKSPTQIRH